MDRFRCFFGCEVNRRRMDPALFEEAGIAPRYLPDEFESFDEMDFLVPLDGEKRLVVSAALEEGKIMRILLGWVGPDDPDDAMHPLDEEDLGQALEMNGDALVGFFEKITGRV